MYYVRSFQYDCKVALRSSIGDIAKCIGYKKIVHMYIYVLHAAMALDCVNFKSEKMR